MEKSVWKNTGHATVPPLPADPTLSLTAAAAALATHVPCQGLAGFRVHPAGLAGLVLQVALDESAGEVRRALRRGHHRDSVAVEPEAAIEDADSDEAIASDPPDGVDQLPSIDHARTTGERRPGGGAAHGYAWDQAPQ